MAKIRSLNFRTSTVLPGDKQNANIVQCFVKTHKNIVSKVKREPDIVIGGRKGIAMDKVGGNREGKVTLMLPCRLPSPAPASFTSSDTDRRVREERGDVDSVSIHCSVSIHIFRYIYAE